MNRPLNRRGFLRAAAIAPAAAPTVIRGIVTDAAGASAVGLADMSVSVAGDFLNHHAGPLPSTVARLQSFGVPDCLKKQWKKEAACDSYRLSPEIASMRSVSLAAKWRMQMERNLAAREAYYSLESLMQHQALERFWESARGKAGNLVPQPGSWQP